MSYPEAASIVAFLIQRDGEIRFRDLYRGLGDPDSQASYQRNEEVLRGLYGFSIEELETAWRAHLECQE